MKKTIIALLALSGVAMAFDDTIWTFEDSLSSETGTGLRSCAAVDYGKKNAWGVGESTASYENTNMVAGTKVGDYYLTEGLGKAITLSDGHYLRVKDTYWTNQSGKIGTVKQMLQENGAWVEDNTNDYTNSYTLMAWVKFDDTSNTSQSQAIFGTGISNDNGMAFTLMDNKHIDLCAKGVKDNKSDALTLDSDTWYNIAVTYDYTTKTANFYLNGSLVKTDDSVSNYRYAGDNWSAIGAKYYAADNDAKDVMSGAIAEFKIMSGAYTQEQILAAAHLSTVAPAVPEPTTATLSLLALVGLAARRRRR